MDSPQEISAADNLCWPERSSAVADDSISDFEFAFSTSNPDVGRPITADEIFSDGRILPVYTTGSRSPPREPDTKTGKRISLWWILYGDKEGVAMEEHSEERQISQTVAPADSDELDALPQGSYCVWAPDQCRKSVSTGSSSSSRRWRLRELVVKSPHSERKNKFTIAKASRLSFLPTGACGDLRQR